MKKNENVLTRLVFGAVMAAMVYVVTLFRIPFLGSKIHFANAVCLLCGIFLGPVNGGLAAGLGSALYDVTLGGYDFINALITFVSKFAMAWVCGKIVGRPQSKAAPVVRLITGCVSGALTYVVLYMAKTFVYQKFVYGFPIDAVGLTMYSKLIPSLINALASVIAAPIFYHAVRPALKGTGILAKLKDTAE